MFKRVTAFLFVLVLLGACGASAGAGFTPNKCPTLQAGTVDVLMPAEGVTIVPVNYACAWPDAPVLVASPRGSGDFAVERFEANTLTGAFGSIAIRGEPGMMVHFSWLATHE